MPFPGYYYSGRETTREPVDVEVTSDGLTLQRAGAPPRHWRFDALRLPMRPGPGGPVHIEHGGPPPETLVLLDTAILDRIHDVAPDVARRFPRPAGAGRQLLVVGAGLGLVAALLVALYLLGLPRLADVAAARIPVAWEEKLGRAVFESMAPESARCTTPEVTAVVERLVARLESAGGAHPYRLTVAVVDSSEVNAFAAPGGYIVVYTGLLERMESPEELAGVLAHEIQHVWLRHSTRGLLRRGSTGLLLSLLTGDGGALAALLSTADNLAALAYSRGDEEAADREGMRLMKAARLDPAGMIAAFRTLKEVLPATPGLISYLSTHPEPDARIATLEAAAATHSGDVEPFVLDRPWAELRRACAGGS